MLATIAARAEEPAIGPLARDLLAAHNKEREVEKLEPLKLDEALTKAALEHARDMAEHRNLSHEGSDGSTPFDRIKRFDYHYAKAGENVAEGQRDVAGVMRTWMNSEGHRANILGAFTQMGAARAKDGDGRPYWCVVFGKPFPKVDPKQAAGEALEKINAARKEAGKEPPLKPSSKLDEVARSFALAMAASAGDKTGEKKQPDLVALLKDAGVSFRSVGMCVGVGNPTVDDAMKSILKDERQKEAVLGTFRSVGIGYAKGADGLPYWCVLLVEE
ncbi:CAP domain-containing protein [Paludisphaera rhizosphaerae]|uniref:CAP domain-containing protein n=1 Tax=Paludisphaera rhizosphaerae TaxID=2711216 RepID=UPI0013EC6773|nr:CAP domain-containing protein [Paludisphaera rhizosphaerae]